MEVKRHTPLTDKMVLHYFELPKLPGVDSIRPDNEKDLWLALFNAETEEELAKLAENGGTIMSHAVEAYREVTATEEFRYLERLRTRTRHDEAQALRNAERLEREKWQGVVADKEAVIERLRQEIAELRARKSD